MGQLSTSVGAQHCAWIRGQGGGEDNCCFTRVHGVSIRHLGNPRQIYMFRITSWTLTTLNDRRALLGFELVRPDHDRSMCFFFNSFVVIVLMLFR